MSAASTLDDAIAASDPNWGQIQVSRPGVDWFATFLRDFCGCHVTRAMRRKWVFGTGRQRRVEHKGRVTI